MSWMSFILNDYRETCEAADAPEWDDEAELDRLRDLDAASLPPYGTPDWFARDFACNCYDFEEAAASAIADAFGETTDEALAWLPGDWQWDVYASCAGLGVGIWDGRWDALLEGKPIGSVMAWARAKQQLRRKPTPAEVLDWMLRRKLSDHVDDSSSGSVQDAAMAYWDARLSQAVRQYLDLSTAHMPESEPDFGPLRACEHGDDDAPDGYEAFGYTVFLSGYVDERWLADCRDDGEDPYDELPEWLQPIVERAKRCNAKLLVFDRDAEVDDTLPTYEW